MGQNFQTSNTLNMMKDSLFSLSEKKLEYSFELYVIKTNEIKSKHYFGLIVAIDNVKCDQFIIKKEENNIISNMCIKVKASNIKLKMISNNNFLEIKNYEVVDKKKEIAETELNLYKFELPNIVENLYHVPNNKNISIKLKSEEIEYLSSYEYKFSNNYSTNISVYLKKKLYDTIENNKIYLFNGFNYNSISNSLTAINISSVEILDQDSDIEKIIYKNSITAENGEIINIQGTIIEVSLKKCSAIIEESNSKNHQLYPLF